jgi:5'-nucleotidase
MTILLTNDDGIDAPGLYALAEALLEFDEVFIAAPAREHSGAGHAITIRSSIRVEELDDRPAGVKRLSIHGTPADAVKFTLRHHLDHPPALLVSGPNTGPNVGVNVLYSGTLGAAYESVIQGVSALAVSSVIPADRAPFEWDACAHYTRRVIGKALEREHERRAHPEAHRRHGEARPFLWNLNVPARAPADVRGLAVTRHGASGFEEFFVQHREAGPGHFRIDGVFQAGDPSDGYDASALEAGYASLTPLSLDLTDEEHLGEVHGLFAPGDDSP